jgi:hypothetical protein
MSSDVRAVPSGPFIEAWAGRLPDHLDAERLGLSREPFQVLEDLAARCCGSSTRT